MTGGLRSRLALVVVLAVALAAGLLAFGVSFGARPDAVARLDADLLATAHRLSSPAQALLGGGGDTAPLVRAADDTGFLVVVADGSDVLLRAGHTSGGPPAPDPDSTGLTSAIGTAGLVRWRTVTVPVGGGVLQVAGSYLRLQRDLVPLRHRALLPGLAAALLAGLAAWWFAGRALRPLVAELAGATRFRARVGHELRTPLTSLRANLDLLERPDVGPDERAEIAAAARRSATRLDATLDELQQRTGVLDLAAVAGVVRAEAQVRYPDATVELVAPAEPVLVRAAEPGLHGALENVVENALRHGAGPTGKVRLTLRADGTLLVDDDGPGIPPDERHAVLQPFRRGSGAAATGQGLGLTLALEFVEAAGGRLEVGDSPLGGARVSVHLPATEKPQRRSSG